MARASSSAFRNVRLNLEILEARELPSAVLSEVSFDSGAYATDRILVRWLDDTPVAASFVTATESLGNHTYSIQLASGMSVNDALVWYRAQSGVDFAQADTIIESAKTANDTYTAQQWALNTIGASTAWNYTTGSKQIIVAVIDTGVDYNHTDLAANIWKNTREIAGNGRDDDGNGYTDDYYGYNFSGSNGNPLDDNGHGTHVAGIIGAVGNNGTGVAGTNWNVQIMSLKFMSSSGSGYTSSAVSAIYYAVNNGAKIINNSWGGGTYDQALASAIQYAQSRGVIVVNAAGNSAANVDASPFYPASLNYANVISVAASDQNNNLASFSNYGANTVDIAAPGVSILSTYTSNRYAYYSGTSMAAPYVAGAAALLWSQNPTWTYTQVISSLLSNTTASAGLSGKVGSGVLNIGKALQASAPSQPSTPAPYVTQATFAGSTSTVLDRIRLTFSSAINSSTFTAADVALTGPDGKSIAISSITAVAGSNNTQYDVKFAAQSKIGTYTASVGPDIRDTYNRQMDQNRNGTSGETTDKYSGVGTLNGRSTFSSGNVNLAIRDLQTTTSTITVGQHITIADLKVTLYIEHTYNSDLVIKLVSPQGKEIILSNRRGGSGDNFTSTTFDASATTSIANGAAPFRSTFRPEGSLTSLAGLDAYGTLKLVVSDVVRNDSGKLVNWSLAITSASGAARSQSNESSVAETLPAPIIPDKFQMQSASSGWNAGSYAIGISPMAWIATAPACTFQSNSSTQREDRHETRDQTAAPPLFTTLAAERMHVLVDAESVAEETGEAEPLEADLAEQLAALFIVV